MEARAVHRSCRTTRLLYALVASCSAAALVPTAPACAQQAAKPDRSATAVALAAKPIALAPPVCEHERRGPSRYVLVRQREHDYAVPFRDGRMPPESGDMKDVVAKSLRGCGYQALTAEEVVERIRDAYWAPKRGAELTPAMIAVRKLGTVETNVIHGIAKPEKSPDDFRIAGAKAFWGTVGHYLRVRYVMRTVVTPLQSGTVAGPLRETTVTLLLYDTETGQQVWRGAGTATRAIGEPGNLEDRACRQAISTLPAREARTAVPRRGP
jgi:hypothetical protein